MFQRLFCLFQSTLPLRGATQAFRVGSGLCEFQSTLPLRGATFTIDWGTDKLDISIHTPLAGSDMKPTTFSRSTFLFQSTLPLRGATRTQVQSQRRKYFNPHSPCGERPYRLWISTAKRRISIHTPLAGSDLWCRTEKLHNGLFQSTLPLRGATTSNSTKWKHRRFQSTLPLRGATAEMRHF